MSRAPARDASLQALALLSYGEEVVRPARLSSVAWPVLRDEVRPERGVAIPDLHHRRVAAARHQTGSAGARRRGRSASGAGSSGVRRGRSPSRGARSRPPGSGTRRSPSRWTAWPRPRPRDPERDQQRIGHAPIGFEQNGDHEPRPHGSEQPVVGVPPDRGREQRRPAARGPDRAEGDQPLASLGIDAATPVVPATGVAAEKQGSRARPRCRRSPRGRRWSSRTVDAATEPGSPPSAA